MWGLENVGQEKCRDRRPRLSLARQRESPCPRSSFLALPACTSDSELRTHHSEPAPRYLRKYMHLMAVETLPRFEENRAKGESVHHRPTLTIVLFLAANASLAAARDLAVVSNKA